MQREGVRLASLPAVGEDRPGFPLWLCPLLTPTALLFFIQKTKQLPESLCYVPARPQSIHTHTHTHSKCWNNWTLMHVCVHAYIHELQTWSPSSPTRCAQTSVTYAHTHFTSCVERWQNRERARTRRLKDRGAASVGMRDVHCSGRGTKGALGLCALWHERVLIY